MCVALTGLAELGTGNQGLPNLAMDDRRSAAEELLRGACELVWRFLHGRRRGAEGRGTGGV